MKQYHILSLILVSLVLCLGRMVVNEGKHSPYLIKPTDYSSRVTVTQSITANTTSGNRTNSSSQSNTTSNATKPANGTTNANSTKTNSTTNTTSGNSTKTNTTTNTTSGNSTKPANTTNNTSGNSTKPANSTGGNSTKPSNGTANVTKAWLKFNNNCFGCVIAGYKYCSLTRACIPLADTCIGNTSQPVFSTVNSCPVKTECQNFGINGLVFVSDQNPVSNVTTGNFSSANNSANNTPVVPNKGS